MNTVSNITEDAKNAIRNRKRRLSKYPTNLSRFGLRKNPEDRKFYFIPVANRIYTPGIYRSYPDESSRNSYINYCVCSDILTEILGMSSPLWTEGYCSGCDNPTCEEFHDKDKYEDYKYHFISEADAVLDPYDLNINYADDFDGILQKMGEAGFEIEDVV